MTSIGDRAFYACRSLESITIPASVTSIGAEAFYYCSSLTDITIPASVTSIGDRAFYACRSLESITIPASVTSIGSDAFKNCEALSGITIPATVTYIGEGAFDGCDSLNAVYYAGTAEQWAQIEISSGNDILLNAEINHNSTGGQNPVEHIHSLQFFGRNDADCLNEGNCDYWYCSTCEKYYLDEECNTEVDSNDVKISIGDHTYDEWAAEVPASCTATGTKGHYSCLVCGKSFDEAYNIISSLNIPKTKHNYVDGQCSECGRNEPENEGTEGLKYVLNSDNASYSVSGIESTTDETEIIIPEEYNGFPVTGIEAKAFRNCSGLTSITLPDSITNIGIYAFAGCDNLTYNEYENGYYLGNENNPHLALIKAISTEITSCTINENCKFIDCFAFHGCNSLTYNEYDNGYYLGNENNPHLVLVKAKSEDMIGCTINENCKFIQGWAFSDWSCLACVIIPASVTSIGYNAFDGCTDLTAVHYNGSIADWCNIKFVTDIVQALEPKANPLLYAHNLYINNKLVTEIEIPNTVTKIGNQFVGWNGTSITIPDSVTSIGNLAFFACGGLTSITLPSSVTSIEMGAFLCCEGLKRIIIPDSVTSIGYGAFTNGVALEEVYYTGTKEQWEGIVVQQLNDGLLNSATFYYYSSSDPYENDPDDEDCYWHYVDGEVTVWTK